MAQKKRVFLTGASGNMGFQSFKEFMKHKDQYDVVVLLRDSQKNREKFADYMNDPSVTIVWGDLKDYDKILECVTGANYVLHIGGMVSPAADYFPTKTVQTNTTAARNIVNAVKAQPNADDIKVVYIGTVAETGDRNMPIHWARCGDPVKISIYDHYACSKVLAEQIFAESGLKHWVSCRQSGILYADILKNMDPIMFHVCINGVLEWATVEDSARLMLNITGDDIPEEFWRRFYNIGSGEEYRLTNFEFEELLLDTTLGLGSPKKVFQPNWFITRNFHGQWYYDGDELEKYCHFRANVPVVEYFKSLLNQVQPYFKLAKFAKPFSPIVKAYLKTLADKEIYGTLWWLKNGVEDRITSYFGSMEEYNAIPSKWEDYNIVIPSKKKTADDVIVLDHGYDETKNFEDLTLEDLQKAAQFRGGECLATEEEFVDVYTPIKWKSARGNEFMMSANLVLRGGHWCPQEFPTDCEGKKFFWNYDEEAKLNPFFKQVWAPLHKETENNVYTEKIFKGFVGFENI